MLIFSLLQPFLNYSRLKTYKTNHFLAKINSLILEVLVY